VLLARIRPTETVMTYRSRVVTVSIDRPVADVAAFLADPRNFPRWASGLAGGLTLASASRGDQDEWLTETPQGRVKVRFSPANAFGVADHWVHLPDATIIYVPLRAIANGDGADVSLTLFQYPGMDEARFALDADWVERDLAALKRLLEAGMSAS
jgi:hypothetical protein